MRTLLLVTLFVLAAGGYVWSVERRLAETVILEDGAMRTEWTSGGVRRSVVTQRNPSESNEAWLDRHMAEVREAQVQFPPD